MKENRHLSRVISSTVNFRYVTWYVSFNRVKKNPKKCHRTFDIVKLSIFNSTVFASADDYTCIES